ncbi:MAG: PQQ-binding-like beta-propeller repeat protein [Gemmatales bacterium]|nr:PQQ-binding-like beta-propeller repeat protein [Gemmatales bacterium]MDW8387492.1 PQQ-binding-like beta-propeller repeat protein [Gemmatales bacterium]
MQRGTIARWVSALVVAMGVSSPAIADDWPQWLGPQRDGVWRETGILRKFPPGGPKVLWRTPIGAGYTGPAVAEGRVFVMDRITEGGRPVVSNSFSRGGGKGTERVLCLDASNGQILWKHEYECTYRIMYPLGPRCTPTVHEGKVYTLGAMGDLFCFQADNGKVLWSKKLPQEYKIDVPPAGYATHPVIYKDKLICMVGGDGSTVVAFNKDTGKEVWRAVSATEPGYCPPMLIDLAGKPVLIAWDPEHLNALDPDTGEILWSKPFRCQMNMNIVAPRLEGDKLFISSYFNNSMVLKLYPTQKPTAEVIWGGREKPVTRSQGLNAMMCTPFIRDGYIYGICSKGELRCVKLDTGERIWETLAPTTGGRGVQWANAFLVPNGDVWFLANEKGELIIARLTPQGYEELDRAKILEPTHLAGGREVVWSHPAFANGCLFARNDKEIVCVDLRAK